MLSARFLDLVWGVLFCIWCLDFVFVDVDEIFLAGQRLDVVWPKKRRKRMHPLDSYVAFGFRATISILVLILVLGFLKEYGWQIFKGDLYKPMRLRSAGKP